MAGKKVPFFLAAFLFFIFAPMNQSFSQVNLTGFSDIVYSHELRSNSSGGFLLNQFELDISHDYTPHLSFGTAIAWDPEKETLGLAMAYVHYNIMKGKGKHPRKTEEYSHTGFVFGKFDVPFGIDYLSYASPDRPVVNQPLPVQQTMGGWNDIGVNFHIVRRILKLDVWIVNGYYDLSNNFGVNLRARLTRDIELGVSVSSDVKKFSESDDWLAGIHLIAKHDIFDLRAEVIRSKGVYMNSPDSIDNFGDHGGFYIQLVTDFEKFLPSFPLNMTLRYSFWGSQDDHNADGKDDTEYRYTLGVGHNISENFSARTEYYLSTFEDEYLTSVLMFQVVATF
jgi:hypothetical protein